MSGTYPVPPPRDLPPGRLAQRRAHLLAEITREGPERAGASRRPGWTGRRKILVLAAAALIGVVGTASAIGSARDFILHRGVIGLPPEGATPSAPERADLVAHWEGFRGPDYAHVSYVRVWVYSDGRMIWDRRAHGPAPVRVPGAANKANSGYLEQRLTPEGVELVRSGVAELFARASGLLERFPAQNGWWDTNGGRLALTVPNDFPTKAAVEVPDGDELVRLQWGGSGESAKDLAERRARRDGTFASAEQLSALRRVDALLTDPASVLPASAWAVRGARAYVPTHYAVCIDTAPPKDPSAVLATLPVRAAQMLAGKSRTRSGHDLVSNVDQKPGHMAVIGQSVRDCFKLDASEAYELAGALSGLKRWPGWKPFGLAYSVAESRSNSTRLWFEPYFPDGRFAFSGPFG